jgi:hypothetical protein
LSHEEQRTDAGQGEDERVGSARHEATRLRVVVEHCVDTELPAQERQYVGVVSNAHAGGLTLAVTGAPALAQQHWPVSLGGACPIEHRSHLASMQRIDA